MHADEVRGAVVEALHPDNFFTKAGIRWTQGHFPSRTLAWELLGGHLLDEHQTRQQRPFEAWDVALRREADDVEQPLLSILFDADEPACYVVRHLLVHGWETYEERPNVILTRPARRWTRELVGSVPLDIVESSEAFRAAIGQLVLMALIGASRLPVTSLETPLPAFLLGECGYVGGNSGQSDRRDGNPAGWLKMALSADISPLTKAKALETALRASELEDIPRLAELLTEGCGGDVPSLIRTLFNHAALTPYTQFGGNFIELLSQLAQPPLLGPQRAVDLVGYLLRHLVRHVTAFDLETFHNRGADYPDLLLLDGLLKLYLSWIERHAEELFLHDSARRRRRALRQAWLVRKHYEGLKVPEVPTSPGDHLRVLPEAFPRVAEEEILQPHKRRVELFAGDPLEQRLTDNAEVVLMRSLADLTDDCSGDAELRELGMAVFLDRPLGIAKSPGEVDRTPLLSYEAFSREVAEQRLGELHGGGLIGQIHDALVQRLRAVPIKGLSPNQGDSPPRPGIPCLEDANLRADDFVFLRTTRGSLDAFLLCFDLQPLRQRFSDVCDWLAGAKDVLLIRIQPSSPDPGRPLLIAADGQMDRRLELGFDGEPGDPIQYAEAVGREGPAKGLCVVRVDGEQQKIRLPRA